MLDEGPAFGAGHVHLKIGEHRTEQRKGDQDRPLQPHQFLHLVSAKLLAAAAVAHDNRVGRVGVEQLLPLPSGAMRTGPRGRVVAASVPLPDNLMTGRGGGFGQPQALDIGAKEGKLHAFRG
jgi:hypothetical protein